jgi:hypothetical protein
MMRPKILFCFSLFLAVSAIAQEQHPHLRLSEAEFVSLAARCAPGAPPDTLLAIARTESGLNPNAISINRLKAAARLADTRTENLSLENNLRTARRRTPGSAGFQFIAIPLASD